MEIKRKKLPESMRKYIRLKKAQIRKQTVGKEEQEKLIQELYQKIAFPSQAERPKVKEPKAEKPKVEKAKAKKPKAEKPVKKVKKSIKKETSASLPAPAGKAGILPLSEGEGIGGGGVKKEDENSRDL